jgi:hypothetical protein
MHVTTTTLVAMILVTVVPGFSVWCRPIAAAVPVVPGFNVWCRPIAATVTVFVSTGCRLLLRSCLYGLTRRLGLGLGLGQQSRCDSLGLTGQQDCANGDCRAEEMRRQLPDTALNGHYQLLKFIGTSPAVFAGGDNFMADST